MESIAPSTAHQIKSYYMKYVQWCEARHLIQLGEGENGVRYDQLPLSPVLVHCFILEKVVLLPSAIYSLGELKNYIDSFLFLNKLCSIHTGKETGAALETYLSDVFRLHQRWHSLSSGSLQTGIVTKMIKVSLNMWNPGTTELSDKFFKTSMEKLRFLTDFHMYSYLNWSYKERAGLKLSSFSTTADGKGLIIKDGSGNVTSVLLPQDCPFICPLTTLAAYLYLRFYGVKPVYRGDGFPDLMNGVELPLIRGKSLTDYPKEETMSNYYSTVFKYCSLGYKRRVYFNSVPESKNENFDVRYPLYDEIDSREDQLPDFNEVFPDKLPIDFQQILNLKTPQVNIQRSYNPVSACNPELIELPPNDLLVQVFPEIEEYKREKYDELSKEAQEFLKVMELLRNTFVLNLPWLYKFFPTHELFKDQTNLFQNSDFQIFINDRISHILHPSTEIFEPDNIPPILRVLPGYHSSNLDQQTIGSYLVEQNLMVELKSDANQSQINVPSVNTDPAIKSEVQFTSLGGDKSEQIKKETFKYIQFQTLSNFNLIIDLLEKVFEKLEMKRSTREFIINKIEVLKKTTKNRLDSVTPEEIVKYFEEILGTKEGLRFVTPDERRLEDKNDTASAVEKKKGKEKKKYRLLSIDDDMSGDSSSESSSDDESNDNSSDDEEEGGDNGMQSELRTMIDELVSTKISSLFEIKMEQLEMKLENKIEKLVNEKVESILETKINKRLRTLERDTQGVKRQKREEDVVTNESPAVTEQPHSADTVIYPFRMTPELSTIEEIIQEWYTPDPAQDNMCVHAMNKKYKSKWRSGFEALYRERKPIVDFFIYLVNVEKVPRAEAIKLCWDIKEQYSYTFAQLSRYLRDWKDSHGSSFTGLLKNFKH